MSEHMNTHAGNGKRPMSLSRKLLMVLSIIYLVVGAFELALSIYMATGAASAELLAAAGVSAQMLDEYGLTASQFSTITGIVFIVVAVWNIFIALMSIRGAKNPRKLGFVTVIYGISALISVVTILQAIAARTAGAITLQALIPVVIFIACLAARKEVKE